LEREKLAREQEEVQARQTAIRQAEDLERQEQQRQQQDRREYNKFRKESFQPIPPQDSESERIKELERQLEEARARERAYLQQQHSQSPVSNSITPPSDLENENERSFLKKAWANNNGSTSSTPATSKRPLPVPPTKPAFSKSLPHATLAAQRQRQMQDEDDAEETAAKETSYTTSPAPPPTPPRNSSTSETKSPPSATKWGFQGARSGSVLQKNAPSSTMSIVQREMEMERQRQKEWEMNQAQLVEDRKLMTNKEIQDGSEMPWDINQYGYMGGANQGTEQVAFGTKRQIIGPRNQR